MGDTQTNQRFKFIDGLRGIAALLVVIFHNYQMLTWFKSFKYPFIIDQIISQFHLGIAIFFVLSGFVIAYSIRQSLINLKYSQNFFIKRSIRLDPPYWATLFMIFTVSFISKQLLLRQGVPVFDFNQIIANFFYVQYFLGFVPMNPVSWTLCIELQLYLFFVLILACIFWFKNVTNLDQQTQATQSFFFLFLFMGSLIFSLEQNYNLFLPQFMISPLEGLFIPYWYSFLIGVVVCWAMIGWLSRKWLCAYFLVLFIYAVTSLQNRLIVSLLLGILIDQLNQRNLLVSWTCSSVFQYLGKISYSLYLTHWLFSLKFVNFILEKVGEIGMIKATLLQIGATSFAIICAHFFYQWIEYPCLKWSQKIGKKQLVSQPLTEYP